MKRKKQRGDEKYEQRVNTLRGAYYHHNDPSIREVILKGLDSLIQRSSSYLPIHIGKKSEGYREYIEKIKDEKVAKKIERILTNPDSEQILRIFREHGSRKIGEDIGCPPNTVNVVVRRLTKRSTKGYRAGQLAHWLIHQGYED